MLVKNRQQMAALLNERMNRTYSALSERQELEPDTALVKTYLLEAHLPESAEPERALQFAEESFNRLSLGRNARLATDRAEEETLLSVEIKLKRERFTVYVDFTNPRYWFLHSMGSSTSLDWVIQRLLKTNPRLDHAWLPANFLEAISRMGSFRGLGLDYDRRVVPDVDFHAAEAPVEFLKMQLWGNKAAGVLHILRDDGAFPHETTLSKVKIKFHLNGEEDGEFSLDDIKYDGKVTARGTSFQSHVALVSHIFDAYADKIRTLEERFAIEPREEDGRLFLKGEPVHLLFDRPISDLTVFCERIFSCGQPFRLWGVPVPLGSDYYRVRAVDLHVGTPIDFEIAPEFVRVYLPAGSCGNSVMRMYTNLQHHYDSLVRAEDGNGRPVFEF